MRFVIVMILLVLAVVFAVQNATMVTLTAYFWRLDASLAVIIVLCFATGALVASLAVLPSLFRARSEQRKLQARVAILEKGESLKSPVITPAEPAPLNTPPATPISR